MTATTTFADFNSTCSSRGAVSIEKTDFSQLPAKNTRNGHRKPNISHFSDPGREQFFSVFPCKGTGKWENYRSRRRNRRDEKSADDVKDSSESLHSRQTKRPMWP
jgi:hypothetical protein